MQVVEMASIYKRGDVWWVKYYVGARPVYKSLKTAKKAEALSLKQAIEAQLLHNPGELQAQDTPVGVFWQGYIQWAGHHKRPKTLKLDQMWWAQLMHFCRPRMLGDITPRDIEAFKSKRLRDGLKPSSMNGALRHLQSIYSHAIKLGYFSSPNPVKGVTRLKVEKTPPRYLAKDEIERLMQVAKGHSREALIVFGLGMYAGLRRAEIANAKWEWFDFDAKLISVSGNETFRLRDVEHRIIPFHDRLREYLSPYRQEGGYLLAPEKTESKNEYRYDFKKMFKTVVQKAGLEWATPHVLRHTFASQLAIAGVSLYKISNWLGHADVKTTQVYARLQAHDDDINRF